MQETRPDPRSPKKSHDVLLITRNLPPLCGGMERLNLHIARSLSGWCSLTVIGPEGCAAHLPERIEVVEVPAAPLGTFLKEARRAVSRISARDFDMVLAGSGLTAPLTRKAAKRGKAKTIAYVHGLDIVTRHPLYRLFWMHHLRRMNLALANSRNTAHLAAQRGVAGGRITVINPGVSIPEASSEIGKEFRARHNLGDRPILLSVGRLTPRKGLAEFIRHALPGIRRAHPDIALVIIGDEAPNALAGSALGSRSVLRKLAAELDMEECLFIFGPCDDETLEKAYFAADVHIFPIRDIPGDVEGFGMVAIEAAAHGLPSVAFAVGGVSDAIEAGRSGYLVQPGDYNSFAGRTCEILEAGAGSNWTETTRKTAETFTWDLFSDRLRQALTENIIGKSP